MRLFYATLLAVLCLCPTTLYAQTYGEWDRPCDLNLAPHWSAPFVSGVMYGGHEWLTSWRSINQFPPLPSYNWYEATPNPNPVSTDGTAQWVGAQVEGHCTVEQNPYYVTFHVYPVAYRGTVVPCGSGGGGGGPWEFQTDTDPSDPSYDPYSSNGGTYDCAQSGPDNGDDTGGDRCHQEYVYIDEWFEGEGWVEIWEGWATVCE